MTGAPDFVAVLTTHGKALATKEIVASSSGPPVINSYKGGARFDIRKAWVSDIDDVAILLDDMPSCSFIIHGAPKDGLVWRGANRWLRDRRGEPATIEPTSHFWVPVDIDSLPAPEWFDITDPDPAVEYIVSHLPEEFRGATCWWGYTGGQGFKPGINIRLVFWSDRPMEGWQLKQWLHGTPADTSIYTANQAIYIARPVFVGLPDPVPFRSGVWRGDRDAITPPIIEKAAPSRSTPRERREGDSFTSYALGLGIGGYEHYRGQIGDHDGGDGFHQPVKSAVASWLAINGSTADTAWLRDDLEKAIREAPRDTAKHPDDYIEFRVLDLDPLIDRIAEWQAESEAEEKRLAEEVIAAHGTPGLSPRSAAALDGACRRIASAKEGDRDKIINGASYGIGRLVGAGALPRDFALRVLHFAASKNPSYVTPRDDNRIDRSFVNGTRNPEVVL